jgi:signal transduction histidine kinase/CheY-like chemotaxis protein
VRRTANLQGVPGEHRLEVAATLGQAGWETPSEGCEAGEDCLRVLWLDEQSAGLPGPDAAVPTLVIIATGVPVLDRDQWPAPCPWTLVPWPVDPAWLGIAAEQAGRLAAATAGEDVSDQGEAALREALRRARAMSEAKSTFIASISHELRTPMNAVIGYSGLLMELGLEGEAEAYVHSVYTSANHLLTLINDVLDFSRIEAGELRLEQTAFDVRECVKSAIEILAGSAADKGLALRLECRGEGGRVIGDPTRLRQIVLNLLSNACKFTDRGEVAVDLGLCPLGRRTDVRIVVADTGIGMDAATIARLFQPFRQGDDSMNRRFGGTGLGLSICKRLVDLQAGTIRVHSEPGVGSRFVVELSLPTGEDMTADPERPSPLLPGSRAANDRECDPHWLSDLRILIVEDNPVNQWLLMLQIESLGGNARPAGSGAEALALASGESFDVIFMDIEMPEMDGIETTLRLRRDAERLGLQPYIVAATAHVLGDSRSRFLEAGMDDFLGKPVLVEQLRDVLGRARMARSGGARRQALSAGAESHR